MVYLVGAGPGDPGLITVKALNLLKKADVVLFDKLIDTGLLSNTKPGCALIDVGKRAGKHTKTQDETTELLVELGRKNVEVVRLKGGDPFLFGRGGEEAERLKEEGIPFEIVPGVSALSAVPAYAGIPLTHRDFASSVGFATGHGAHGKDVDPVRWRNMAKSVDTIVVFMGVGNMEAIINELKAGGLTDDTPAGLIEKGTTPHQKVVTGTLATILDEAEKNNVNPPALFVVGKTVTLHDTLKWFNQGPLTGLKIGVTRPSEQSKRFSNKLMNLGAAPVLMPTIKIVDTIDTPQVTQALTAIDSYEALLFFSANGVESFFRAFKIHEKSVDVLKGKVIAAIGPATAEALVKHGAAVDVKAETFIAESLLEAVQKKMSVKDRSFLLVRSDIGRSVVPDGLRDAGARVDDVTFYSTQPEEVDPAIVTRIYDGEIDIITFTSSSTVNGFFDCIDVGKLPKTVTFASIGPETSKALNKHGDYPHITASVYTTDGLIQVIIDERGKE